MASIEDVFEFLIAKPQLFVKINQSSVLGDVRFAIVREPRRVSLTLMKDTKLGQLSCLINCAGFLNV